MNILFSIILALVIFAVIAGIFNWARNYLLMVQDKKTYLAYDKKIYELKAQMKQRKKELNSPK